MLKTYKYCWRTTEFQSTNFDAPYWGKCDRVIAMRNKRGNDKALTAWLNELQLLLKCRDYTIDDVAEAVYDKIS